MRSSNLLIAILLSLTRPTATSPAYSRRSLVCANASSTIAGTLFPRSLSPRHSTNTVLSCAHNSQTYIILEVLHLIPGVAVAVLIDDTIGAVLRHVRLAGDGVISNGMVTWQGTREPFMKTWNSNNHQTTWRVFAAASGALKEFQNEYGWGAASFTVFDGAKEGDKGYIAEAG